MNPLTNTRIPIPTTEIQDPDTSSVKILARLNDNHVANFMPVEYNKQTNKKDRQSVSTP